MMLMPKLRPALVAVLAFVAAAIAAVSVGMVALNSIGTGLGDGPMQPVAGAGASTGSFVSPSAGPSTGASLGPSPTASGLGLSGPDGPTRTFETRGGVVVARCVGRAAYLVSWSPNPGFRTDEVHRGLAETAVVKFRSSMEQIEAKIVCASGVATLVIEEVDNGEGGRN
jgi:hypothetical protein